MSVKVNAIVAEVASLAGRPDDRLVTATVNPDDAVVEGSVRLIVRDSKAKRELDLGADITIELAAVNPKTETRDGRVERGKEGDDGKTKK
jgi:hypothetical protein